MWGRGHWVEGSRVLRLGQGFRVKVWGGVGGAGHAWLGGVAL